MLDQGVLAYIDQECGDECGEQQEAGANLEGGAEAMDLAIDRGLIAQRGMPLDVRRCRGDRHGIEKCSSKRPTDLLAGV